MRLFFPILLMSLLSSLSAADCVDDATGAFAGMGGCAVVLGWGTACDAVFAGTLVSGECPVSCNTCPGVCGDGIYDWDETSENCPEDVPGCNYPALTLGVLEDGAVVYNSYPGCIYCTDPAYTTQDACNDYGDDGSGDATWTFDPAMDQTACCAAYPLDILPESGDGICDAWYNGEMAGFEFKVDGVTLNGSTAASGGAAEDAGFTMSTNPELGKVVGFSVTGSRIATGCGILTKLDIVNGTPTGLHSILIANYVATALPFSFYKPGCNDATACNFDEFSTDDDGICLVDDCAGVCGGDCSVCDCAGVCGGSAVISGCDDGCNSTAVYDECGVCDNDASNDCVQDCNGVWGGDAEVDNCGVCDNDASNDCVQDCAGVWGGTAVLSGCDNACNSTAVYDECGVCDGDNTFCADCAGVPNGDNLEDNCGTCDNDSSNDCVCDTELDPNYGLNEECECDYNSVSSQLTCYYINPYIIEEYKSADGCINTYKSPTDQQLNQFSCHVQEFLNDPTSYNDGDSGLCLVSLSDLGYEIIDTTYNDYIIFFEKDTDPSQDTFDKGWGTFVYNTSADNENLIIEVNHPDADEFTEWIGTRVFEDNDAAWLLVAGAERWACVAGQECTEGENCGADMAREENSVFQVFHEEITNYFNGDVYALSIHGFSGDNYDTHINVNGVFDEVGIAISNGDGLDGNILEPSLLTQMLVGRFNSEILGETDNYEQPAITVYDAISYNYFNFDSLGARLNPQGTYTNTNFSSLDPRWIHIEADNDIRKKNVYGGFRDQYYDAIEQAVYDFYNSTNLDSYGCDSSDHDTGACNLVYCDGTSNSGKIYDDGVCECGEGMPEDCIINHEGICGGAVVDDCGVCSGGNSGHTANTDCIVINEVMQNPSMVNDNDGEWFELYNYSENTIDLAGWTISDNGNNSYQISNQLIIQPHSFLVLGNNSTTATNGGVSIDYQYDDITLSNGEDEIILTGTIAGTVDSIAYDNGVTFPDESGISMTLLDPMFDNNIGSNWALSTTPYGDGDLGTPGLPNFGGNIELSQEAVSFDTTAVGDNAIKSITIYNIGAGGLSLDSIYTTTSIFQLSLNTASIDVGDSLSIDITFAPDEYGVFSDTLFIHSDDYDEKVVIVELLGIGYVSVSHIDVYPDQLSFPNIMVGLSSEMSITLYNTGEDVLIVDSIYTNIPDFIPSILEANLQVGDSLDFEVIFTPQEITSYNDTLIISSNDPDNSTLNINLNGNGIEPASDIVVIPDSLDFGMISTGETVELSLQIINGGVEELEIEEVSFGLGEDSPFWTDFEDATLEYNESLTIALYCSLDLVYNSDVMTIYSNDPDEESFQVMLLYKKIINIPQDFSTIQEGIDAVSEGESVIVSAGTYYENIIWPAINGIKLIGSGVDDCIIDGNSLGSVIRFEGGGGSDSTTLITGFTIQNGDGSVISNDSGHPEGGGMHVYNSSPSLTDVTFSNNTAMAGGGMVIYNSSPTLTNVTFSGNTSSWAGGGIFFFYSSSVVLINSILWGNSPDEINTFPQTVAPHLDPNLLFITITYSDIQGGEAGIVTNEHAMYWGDGNIDADPLFCDPDNGDFTLRSDSPCVGTGQNGTDMGAFGVGCEPLISGCTDPEACNYDESATVDDGSCSYAAENYDCDDNCLAEIDDCGECGGNNDCQTNDQSIDFTIGWNIMSFNMTPEDIDMLSILSPLIDTLNSNNSSLVKVQDETGEAIEYISFLSQWSNNIGNMAATEGYYVKVNQATTLTATGSPVDLPLDIDLTIGWNIISYPAQNPQDALDALFGLIDTLNSNNSSLVKVQDETGEAIEYISFLSQWSNNIGNFKSGEGYYVKVNQAATLTIDEPGMSLVRTAYKNKVDPVYFKPAFAGNPYLPMNLYILSASIGDKPAALGTEVGIYDNDICVGSAVIVESLEPESSYLSIPVSQDDPTTDMRDGYIPGSKIDVRVFDGEREYVAHVGDLVFTSQGTEFMSLDISTGPTSYRLYANYPNPFNPTTTIRFDLPYKSGVSIKVYNLQGREVMSLIDGNMEAGYHSVSWNAESYSSGMYFVKMLTGDFIHTQKMMLIK